MAAGDLDIGDEGDTLTVKSLIYRGDSIAFTLTTTVFGINQLVSVDGVAMSQNDDGESFKSGFLVPKQTGSNAKDLYRVQITIKRPVVVSENEARIEGTWALIKIRGIEAFERFEFAGELSFK